MLRFSLQFVHRQVVSSKLGTFCLSINYICKMNKKPEYKLSERDLDIRSDLEFVDGMLKDLQLEVEPQARGVILDLAYSELISGE